MENDSPVITDKPLQMISASQLKLMSRAFGFCAVLFASSVVQADAIVCKKDPDCPSSHICDAQKCVKAERHINVLYLYYRSEGGRFTQTLGLYWHRTGTDSRSNDGYRIVLPFYWHLWNNTAEHRVVFPLFYQWKNETERTHNVVFPPIQWQRNASGSKFRIWPLFFYSQKNHAVDGLSLLPVFSHQKTTNTSTTWVAPWFVSRRVQDQQQDTQHTSFVPLFWYNRNKQTSLFFSVPSLIRHRNAERSWTALFPLFYYSRHYNADATSMLAPLFFYQNIRSEQTRQFAWFAPFYYQRRDPDREVDTLFPVVTRWREKNDAASTWVIPPLWWRQDPRGGSYIGFPVAWHFRAKKAEATTSILFPLFFRHHRQDGSQLTLLFPFHYRSQIRQTDRYRTFGVFPLISAGAGSHGHHAILFPAFWHQKSARGQTTVVGPAYFHRRYFPHSKAFGWAAGLVPLFFAGNEPKLSYQVVFPLFWRFSGVSDATQKHFCTTVAGPVVGHRGANGRFWAVMPIAAAGQWRGHNFVSLPPLYYYRRDTNKPDTSVQVGPYYQRVTATKQIRTLFPLFFFKQSKHNNQTTTTVAVLPLFYSKSNPTQSAVATPIAAWRTDKKRHLSQGIVGPYVWHRSPKISGRALVPLFFQWQQQDAKTWLLFPLAVRHTSNKQQAFVLFPLYWRLRDQKESSTVFFPLYWHVVQQHGMNGQPIGSTPMGSTVIFPIYWRITTPTRQTQIVANYFSTQTREKKIGAVVPLALYHRNQQRSVFASLPGIFYRHDFESKQRTWVVGTGYYRSYKQGYGTGLFPLFFHRRTPENRYTVLTPLIWHFSRPAEQRQTTVVGPAVFHQNKNSRSFSFVPLYYQQSDSSTGERSYSVFPLFYYKKEVDRVALYTPLAGVDASTERRRYYVGPYWRQTGAVQDYDLFAPLFFYQRKHLEQQKRLIALPLYVGQWSREAAFHLVFPLYWRWRNIEKTTTVGLPLYWDFKEHHHKRTTVFFPLVMRHRNEAERSTSYLVPGAWVKSHSEGTDAVVFPLFWRFAGKERSTTVGFPLYWDIKRPGQRRTTIFAPFYWRFENHKETSYVVVNTYYHRNKRDNTYAFHFIPLFEVGRRRPGDMNWEVLTGLVGYERIGARRFMTLLYFFSFELDPPPKPNHAGLGRPRRAGFDL